MKRSLHPENKQSPAPSQSSSLHDAIRLLQPKQTAAISVSRPITKRHFTAKMNNVPESQADQNNNSPQDCEAEISAFSFKYLE